MRRAAATVIALALAGAAFAQDEAREAAPPAAAVDAAREIVCGEPYAIRRGDTLQRLAVRVYGPEATYHVLWEANRERLGLRDPSLLEIGQSIIAPCPISIAEALENHAGVRDDAPVETARQPAAADEAPPDGALAAPAAPPAEASRDAAAPATPDPQPATQPEPAAALTVVRLPGSALAQEIALRALAATLGDGGFEIADAPDAVAEAGGLRFPLARPDRASGDALVWSAPLLEQTLVWHAHAYAAPMTAAALSGLRVCRADSAPRAALATPPGARVRDGGDARACLTAVAEGGADVAVSEAAEADAALRDPALAAAVAEQPALTRLVALAAAAPADDPVARAALAALDLGLARLRESGAWFSLVDAALAGDGGAP